MTTVGVRELKNRLSHYLRLVRSGEHVLVTDRGEVVAELAPPREGEAFPPALLALAAEGRVRLGLPNQPGVYEHRDGRRAPAGTALRLLDEDRGDR